MPARTHSESLIDTSFTLLERVLGDVLPRSGRCINRSGDQLNRANECQMTSTRRLAAADPLVRK